MAKGKSAKKKSQAYLLVDEKTKHHYVIRLGRTGYDKLKDTVISKFNPVSRAHSDYKLKKIK